MAEPTADDFTDTQIEAMRRRLAKAWGQSLDHILRREALFYLRLQARRGY